MSEENVKQEVSKRDVVIGSLINTANFACDALGNRIDANECRIVVGVNLIANAFAETSDASKQDVLNRVFATLVQASGLPFNNPPEQSSSSENKTEEKTE